MKSFGTDDKEWKRQTRDDAVERVQKRSEEVKEHKAKAKQDLGRFAVKKQMKVRAMGLLLLWSFLTKIDL